MESNVRIITIAYRRLGYHLRGARSIGPSCGDRRADRASAGKPERLVCPGVAGQASIAAVCGREDAADEAAVGARRQIQPCMTAVQGGTRRTLPSSIPQASRHDLRTERFWRPTEPSPAQRDSRSSFAGRYVCLRRRHAAPSADRVVDLAAPADSQGMCRRYARPRWLACRGAWPADLAQRRGAKRAAWREVSDTPANWPLPPAIAGKVEMVLVSRGERGASS